MTKATMWPLLAVVATAAAVLSFAALRDLAILCSFHERLSFLLPLVVDAGAAAGCLVWLSPKDVTTEARRFARALTWVLLASSVAGNAIVHGLSAYGLQPHWTLVVGVSAVAPAVLGAVVHLSVLVGRRDGDAGGVGLVVAAANLPVADLPGTPLPRRRSARGAGAGLDGVQDVSASASSLDAEHAPSIPPAPSRPKPASVARESDNSSAERARALLADNPTMGRRKLMAETGLKEYDARRLLEQARAEAPRNGRRVLEDAK